MISGYLDFNELQRGVTLNIEFSVNHRAKTNIGCSNEGSHRLFSVQGAPWDYANIMRATVRVSYQGLYLAQFTSW